MDEFIFTPDNYQVLINNVAYDLYKGENNNPFYYFENKEVYLSVNDKITLDNLINKTNR